MNGAYGVPLAAFDLLLDVLPSVGFAVLFVGAIWLISWCRS